MKALVASAHTNLSPSVGSEEEWACNLLLKLVKMPNIQIDAICGRSEITKMPSNLRIFRVGFSEGDLISRGLFRLRCYNVATRLFKNADIIHQMFPFGFKVGFNLLALSQNLKDKAFVVGPIQYPQEYSDINDYSLSTKRKGISAKLFYETENLALDVIARPVELLHIKTLSKSKMLVFESNKSFCLYKNRYPEIINENNSKIIFRPVDETFFNHRPPVRKRGLKILTVGYLLRRKGIQFLINSMSRIVKDFRNVELDIVGDGPFKNELVKLVKDKSLEGYVNFRGHVARSDLPDVYFACDVYVQPSVSEGFLPTATREAMAMGRPVVATNVGSTDEIVVNGKNGFIVNAWDSDSLGKAIMHLLTDEALRLKMGLQNRKTIETLLSWEKVTLQWYTTYQEAMMNST